MEEERVIGYHLVRLTNGVITSARHYCWYCKEDYWYPVTAEERYPALKGLWDTSHQCGYALAGKHKNMDNR